MTIQQLRNVCAFYSQLEERAMADYRPKLAAHAYKQYCRYRMRLNARKVIQHAA